MLVLQRILILCLCLSTVADLAAQRDKERNGNGRRGSTQAVPSKARAADSTIEEKKKANGGKLSAVEEAKIRAREKEKVAKPARNRLRQHIATIVSTTPRRLSPGQSGVVNITLTMLGSSVLRSSSALDVAYVRSQGPFRFGAWSMEPPKPAELDTPFRGHPVYDNTAQITIPVTVSPNAHHKEYTFRFELGAEMTLASAGTQHGPYRMRSTGKLQVGKPVPVVEPLAAGDEESDDAVRAAAVTTADPVVMELRVDDATSNPEGGMRSVVEAVHATPDVDEEEFEDDEFEVDPEYSESDSSATLLWIGGAALLAILAALLFGRRNA